jgi:hypothetical protein
MKRRQSIETGLSIPGRTRESARRGVVLCMMVRWREKELGQYHFMYGSEGEGGKDRYHSLLHPPIPISILPALAEEFAAPIPMPMPMPYPVELPIPMSIIIISFKENR